MPIAITSERSDEPSEALPVFDRFMAFRDTLPPLASTAEPLAQMTPCELKDHLAERRLKDYLDL